MRVDDINSFTALFVAEKKAYLSDDFRKAYQVAREAKNEVEDENFYISFSFVPESPKLDHKCLVADGYQFTYVEK